MSAAHGFCLECSCECSLVEGKEVFKGFGDFNNCEMARKYSSKSNARKQASAMIAKIPFPLASWIAKTFKPQHENKPK